MPHEKNGLADPNDLLRIQEQIYQAVHCGKNHLPMAQALTRACLEFPSLDCVWLWTHKVGAGQMNLEASAGVNIEVSRLLDSYPDSTTVVCHLLVGHEVTEGWEDVWGEASKVFRDRGLNQVGVLPLNLEGRLVGVIGFASKSSEAFDPRLLASLRHSLRCFGLRLEALELENSLKDASQNLDQVFASLDGTLLIVDKAGNILDSNLLTNTSTGEELDLDTVLPGGREILQQFRDHFSASSMVGSTCPRQSHLLGTNGQLIPVDVTVKKGFWHGNGAYFMSCRDITNQLVIEKERDRLVTAIEQTADSIVITNSSGSIQYTNPAFSQLTGYSADEVLGANPRLLKSSRHDKDFYRQMWSTIRRGEIWKGRLVNCKKTGEEYWEETTISPVRDSNGIITHFVGVKHDITYELKLEERLRQSQKLEAIGTLAGGIAHDFNNILYALLGNSQLALDDIPEDHPAHLPLTEIVKAGDRGSALVSKMLAFGQRAERQMKVCPLGPVIAEVMLLARASLPTTIRIEMDLAEDCSDMLLDESQIHQVVLNLCTNAAHAMGSGGGDLTLKLKQVRVGEDTPEHILGVAAGNYLRLSCSDTGEGMDSVVVERIFEPYFTTKKPDEGTGLGLASVHGIVINHEGRIFVDSTQGEGTTFTIFFPVAKTKAAIVEVEPKKEDQFTGQGRVMVVDDEKMITDLIVRGLQKKGYQVVGFQDGIEALEVFRDDPGAFDVVITDQTMPNITGFELASHLSSIRPDLPIILSTGYAMTIDERELHTAGISHLLSKPLKLNDLAGLLREVNKSEVTIKGDLNV